jgi:uncharacterized membrane protein (UPF0127 family)
VRSVRVKVRVRSKTVDSELADTILKKTKGLMFRRSLPHGKGMLFAFDRETHHPFWMFGMRFPIDMIWIDRKKQVVDVTEDARPCLCPLFCKVYRPRKKARYVLEVNVGFVEKNRVKIGDKVRF